MVMTREQAQSAVDAIVLAFGRRVVNVPPLYANVGEYLRRANNLSYQLDAYCTEFTIAEAQAFVENFERYNGSMNNGN